jgi:hypothetical protein
MTAMLNKADRQDAAGARALWNLLAGKAIDDDPDWHEGDYMYLCRVAHDMQEAMLMAPWDAYSKPGDHLQVEAGAKSLYESVGPGFDSEDDEEYPWEDAPEESQDDFRRIARATNQAMMREPWEVK